MNSNCDKIRELIPELIDGTLSDTEIQALRQHLSECPACSAYAGALEKEEQLLSGFFAKFDAGMRIREAEVIDAIGTLEAPSQGSVISVVGTILRSSITRHAAAAAVIVVVALYFVITLTWISQIQEYIRLSEEYIRM
jgi:anti-sigma factor RsiW